MAVVAVLGLIAAACGDSGLPDQSFPDPGPPEPDSSASAPAASAPLFDATLDDPTLESAPDLEGTSWVVDFFAIETGTTNPWPGTELTLSFGSDGTLSGSAGCNTYLGPFQTSGPYDVFEEGVRDSNDGQVMVLGHCPRRSFSANFGRLVCALGHTRGVVRYCPSVRGALTGTR